MTDGLDGTNDPEVHQLIMSDLDKSLSRHTEVLNAIDLVVKDFQQFKSEGPFPLGVSDVRVDDEFVRAYIHHYQAKP